MLRQALTQARRNALLTAMGIGIGILLHVGYSLLGIGLIIQQSVMLFTVLKVIGGPCICSISPGTACGPNPEPFTCKRTAGRPRLAGRRSGSGF